jgi:hypothetical protein
VTGVSSRLTAYRTAPHAHPPVFMALTNTTAFEVWEELSGAEGLVGEPPDVTQRAAQPDPGSAVLTRGET